VLIDGESHGHPSIWQGQIVDAMVEGAVVHGASRMGALRAAELHSFGMASHERIFEWHREGVIDGDDEVAFTCGRTELSGVVTAACEHPRHAGGGCARDHYRG